MIGPPPSPFEIPFDTPFSLWAISLLIGATITCCSFWKKESNIFHVPLLSLGICILLTSPTIMVPENVIWGAYPTVDKQGSLIFYLNSAHHIPLFDLEELRLNAPLRLIGIHIHHLWVTEIFDLFLPLTKALNFHALLNIWLSVFCAYLYIQKVTQKSKYISLAGALCFGLSLHVFRDIQWYTIEKSGLYWIPLFLWALETQRQSNKLNIWVPIIWFGSAFYNLYFSLTMALYFGFVFLWNRDRLFYKSALSLLPAVALVLFFQWWVMHNGPQLGTAQEFYTRSILDVVEIWPPLWNRLELWRLISPLIFFGIFYAVKSKVISKEKFWIFTLFAVLSLGPQFGNGVINPVYWLVHQLPGLWRVAKPENYFHLSYLLLCLWGVRGLNRSMLAGRPILIFLFFGGLWVLTTRMHSVYPHYTLYQTTSPDPDWPQKVFREKE